MNCQGRAELMIVNLRSYELQAHCNSEHSGPPRIAESFIAIESSHDTMCVSAVASFADTDRYLDVTFRWTLASHWASLG